MASGDLPDWLTERLNAAPKAPGCYLMRDRVGEIVYVGKANDLRVRLNQYFQPKTGDTRFFVGLLGRVLGEIDVIVASNPKEALILENELIKAHQPRFNVKLKDDKAFLNIRIAKGHAWPRLDVVRRRKKDGAEYFGPYESASSIRATLKVIGRHFMLRTCKDTEFANRSRPCLEHQIGRCPAPCVLPVDAAAYHESLQEVRLFLQGRSDLLKKRLQSKMAEAAGALEFERAGHYRDQISAIERSLVRQSVRLNEDSDIDALGLYREGAACVVEVLRLRGGVLVGARGYPLKGRELPDDELVEDFLLAYYDGSRPLPDQILVPCALESMEALEELYTETRGKKVRVTYPQRGDKVRLIAMAATNAQKTFTARADRKTDALTTLTNLQKKLGLSKLPARIECYDISNIQGTNAVGSMVVAIDGVLAPKEYRHFNIRCKDTPDDFAMMHEVLTRRVQRGQAEDNLPELIMVDGGKGQLAMAEAVLKELQESRIELAGLAKSRVLDEDGHVKRHSHAAPKSEVAERSEERVYRPGRKNPVNLRQNSNEIFLLQRLRDEAHRFAITHHRKKRSKRTLTSALDEIPGVGPTRRTQLLAHFGSVKGVKAASLAELIGCPGVSEALAGRIHAALHA